MTVIEIRRNNRIANLQRVLDIFRSEGTTEITATIAHNKMQKMNIDVPERNVAMQLKSYQKKLNIKPIRKVRGSTGRIQVYEIL